MIKAPTLKQGDKVVIVSPARKLGEPELLSAKQLLESWGLIVSIGKNALSQSHSYLSGTNDERLEDLQSAINDRNVKAIFAARGGYGTTRILDKLDLSALKTSPKWIVGFSDITSLHLQLFRNGLESIHGIMPVLFQRPQAASSIESLKKILFTGKFELTARPSAHNRAGSATGLLIGGNLSIIAESLGADNSPATERCILLIEEIDEFKYRFDRLLTTLKRSGKFKNLKGLVVGHLTSINDSDLPFGETPEEMVMNAVKEYNFPVAFDFPTGHDFPNLAWRHGCEVSFRVNAEGAYLKGIDLPEEKIGNAI